MKLCTIMWSNYLPLLQKAAESLQIELTCFSTKQINLDADLVKDIIEGFKAADLILLWRTNDGFWENIWPEILAIGPRTPVVVVSGDPSYWTHSNVGMEIAGTVYRYILFGGQDNLANMLQYLQHTIFDHSIPYEKPKELPWQGIFHPSSGEFFEDTASYLDWYARHLPCQPAQYVGLLFSRSAWITGNMAIERLLVESMEKRGIGVLPVFFYPLQDPALGNLGGTQVIERFFMHKQESRIGGLIKLTSFFLGNTRKENSVEDASSGVDILRRLNIPIFGPQISYYKAMDEWLHDPSGLGSQVAWSLAMPEFEGVIEPMIIGATSGIHQPEVECYQVIQDRMERFCARITGWMALCKMPNSQKRIAFILHNNPCASVEATVGGGAHLDTLESVARCLKRLADEGYEVHPPSSGKELIDTIMERKAISEFRFTTTDEIVTKGGALAMVSKEQYDPWFEQLPEKTRARMIEAWGHPPGEEKDGVPAAMLHDSKILVTGVSFGNAVVCVQPKRGCAGSRCDGQVCKILHDPDVPPPHQYVATYQWLAREYGANALVHVGTHGNLEFLPGKSTALSAGCFPDICIDTMPHLYIYNADNPAEGTIAKRRAAAVLVDHMQTVMVQGELYGDLDQLARLLDEYEQFRVVEPARAHTIQHMITDQASALNIPHGITLTHDNFAEYLPVIHDSLEMLKGTNIPSGMHVFGLIPEEKKLADFLHAIIRFDTGMGSLRWSVAQLLAQQNNLDDERLRELADQEANAICHAIIEQSQPLRGALGARFGDISLVQQFLGPLEEAIGKIIADIRASDEMGALLKGFTGGYIEPGPSGLITRGMSDILPTGRNFFSLDPAKIPTPSAWETGKILASKTLEKYLAEEGRYPENIAFYWQSTDIMWTGGEGMAQMMFLLGACPIWLANGRVKDFEIIPLKELGRPRIDITVRISGITRDNFPGTITLLDEIIQSVAMLDEPMEQNHVRRHVWQQLGGDVTDSSRLRAATFRLFASMPGTYQAGTQLAFYASAWKTQKDLAEVFLYWNGYAYGKGVFGEPAHASLKENLKTVELTFNKTVTDEYDLTGCCCYFGTHGGMINAAQEISGREIQNYYGDTRENDRVAIRTLREEMWRIARGKILNPKWIEGMKQHGYKGAAEVSKRVGRLYGWQATAKVVDDAIFDDVTRTFVMNEENRKFFEQNNPWALEEMARRLIEAVEREIWHPAPDVKEALKSIYLEIEGWIEERMGDMKGEYQGGSVDIMTKEDVAAWKRKMGDILG